MFENSETMMDKELQECAEPQQGAEIPGDSFSEPVEGAAEFAAPEDETPTDDSENVQDSVEPALNLDVAAEEVLSQPEAENAADVSDDASRAEMPEAEQSTPRPRRRRRTDMDVLAAMEEGVEQQKPVDYFGGIYEIDHTAQLFEAELKRMQAIINNNARLQQLRNRAMQNGDMRGATQGKMIILTAELTSVHSQFRNQEGGPRQLESVSIHGVELLGNGKKGSLTLVFAGNDFSFYADMRHEPNATTDIPRAQRDHASRMTGCKFQFVPLKIEKNKNGTPFVLCSRAFAMEEQQKMFFFNNNAIAKLGMPAYAYILSAYRRGDILVECMGIETCIPSAYITSRTVITDSMKYAQEKRGKAIEVAVSKLVVDKEKHNLEVQFSGVLREIQLGLAHTVRDIDLASKPRFHGRVYAIGREYYIIRLEENGIFALVKHSNAIVNGVAGEPLFYGDEVSVEVTGKDEATNRVIGGCILRARA